MKTYFFAREKKEKTLAWKNKMGVKNAEKSVKFVREKRFTPVKKNKNRVKNGVHAQIGGSRPKKKNTGS